MQSIATKAALCVVTALFVSGCLTKPPIARLSQRTSVALVLLRDDAMQKKTHPLPAAIKDQLKAQFAVRNLYVQDDKRPLHEALAGSRDTTRRRAQLLREQPKAKHLLLVETQVSFYSQLNGRYKWDIDIKLSIGGRDRPEPMLERQFKLSAFLPFDHQREDEALLSVSGLIARRTADLVDSYFAGKPTKPAAPKAVPDKITDSQPKGIKGDETKVAPPTSQPQANNNSIYFLMVDRFHNGDKTNDGRDVAPKDAKGWHGGDLEGVIQKLDYLQALGVRTLWLSPIFKSRRKAFMGHGAFHGYWVEDFQKVDPHFGTPTVLRKLALALKKRGMGLLLDLVVNHVGYDAPLLARRPSWFHGNGRIKNWQDPKQVVTHDVHGLPDLAQEREPVYQHLYRSAAHWLENYAIDGFRLDAVKHVSLQFWQRFNHALKKKSLNLYS
jgi:hypothetical protein